MVVLPPSPRLIFTSEPPPALSTTLLLQLVADPLLILDALPALVFVFLTESDLCTFVASFVAESFEVVELATADLVVDFVFDEAWDEVSLEVLSTLVDVLSSSDEASTKDVDVADMADVADVVDVDASTLLDFTSVEEASVMFEEEELIVLDEVLFIFDSVDDLVSFLEVAALVLVSCLAELADPDLARAVVFVAATVFLEILAPQPPATDPGWRGNHNTFSLKIQQ